MSTSEEEFLDSIATFEPAFDKATMEELESAVQDPQIGVHRRALLALMTMSSEKLFEACEKNPEAFFDVFRATGPTVAQAFAIHDTLSAAPVRLMIALCGVDFTADDAPFTEEEFQAAIQSAQPVPDSEQ